AGKFETPEAKVGDLWALETESLPSDYWKIFVKEFTQTTADQVKAVAEKLIRRQSLVIVVVGQAETIKGDLEKIAPVTVINGGTAKN
ncbi:MAG: hypothetical protein ACK6DC_11860, partial [Planctomycetota bacterium]